MDQLVDRIWSHTELSLNVWSFDEVNIKIYHHCLQAVVAGSEHMFLFTLQLKDQPESLYLTEVTLCDNHVF